MAFGSDGAEVWELLSALASLRMVRIAASGPDWTRLQTELIRDGILDLAGKFDITVHNTVYGDQLPSSWIPPAGNFDRDECIWSCTKEINARELKETILPRA